MAASDNTTLNTGSGGDLMATDGLDEVNGLPAAANLKVQRTKTGFGYDGELRDVNEGSPLPVMDSERVVDLLAQIAGVLNGVFLRSTGAPNPPSLRVATNSAADANVTATVTGTPTFSLNQISAVSVQNVTAVQAPAAATNVYLGVAQSQAYHMPVIPEHLYFNITA